MQRFNCLEQKHTIHVNLVWLDFTWRESWRAIGADGAWRRRTPAASLIWLWSLSCRRCHLVQECEDNMCVFEMLPNLPHWSIFHFSWWCSINRKWDKAQYFVAVHKVNYPLLYLLCIDILPLIINYMTNLLKFEFGPPLICDQCNWFTCRWCAACAMLRILFVWCRSPLSAANMPLLFWSCM